MHESTARRHAHRLGLRLAKSRRRDPSADDFGLYVLIDDSKGNRLPGAQAPISAFANGEGQDLEGIREELQQLARTSGEPLPS